MEKIIPLKNIPLIAAFIEDLDWESLHMGWPNGYGRVKSLNDIVVMKIYDSPRRSKVIRESIIENKPEGIEEILIEEKKEIFDTLLHKLGGVQPYDFGYYTPFGVKVTDTPTYDRLINDVKYYSISQAIFGDVKHRNWRGWGGAGYNVVLTIPLAITVHKSDSDLIYMLTKYQNLETKTFSHQLVVGRYEIPPSHPAGPATVYIVSPGKIDNGLYEYIDKKATKDEKNIVTVYGWDTAEKYFYKKINPNSKEFEQVAEKIVEETRDDFYKKVFRK